jgi:hypothetical protein
MATIAVTLKGVAPYDGRYQLDLDETELTNREWGWIKRYSGYLPAALEDALRGGDAEFWCAFALILLRRAGKIDTSDAPAVFELLEDAPYAGVAVEINAAEEDDAGPPEPSLNGNETSSGAGSPTSSETPEPTTPSRTGALSSGTSASAPAMSVT